MFTYIFYIIFKVNETSASVKVKEHSLFGEFDIDSCLCEHVKFKMPDGSALRLLSTGGSQYKSDKLLTVKYTKTSPNSGKDIQGLVLTLR